MPDKFTQAPKKIKQFNQTKTIQPCRDPKQQKSKI